MTTEAIFLLKFIAILDLGGALLFTFVAISRKRDPAVTLAWVLGFFLLPVVGMLLYVFFGYQRFALRRRAAPNPLHRLLLLKESAERFPGGEPLAKTPMETLAEALTDFPALGGNRVDVYTRSDDTEEALTRAIRLARHHVHMCYYIFEPDRTGLRFRDLLIEQARRGVECRVLMDAVGSYRIGPSFLKPLQQAGVKTAFFNPFRTFKRPWAFNARNHRKLTVVDGTIGFMGSQNIGHHFWRSGSRRIQWRETDIRLEGPATVELQTVFAEDWHFATGENLLGDAYFPPPDDPGRHPRSTPAHRPQQAGKHPRNDFLGSLAQRPPSRHPHDPLLHSHPVHDPGDANGGPQGRAGGSSLAPTHRPPGRDLGRPQLVQGIARKRGPCV
ncbi:MAG: PLDc N-terminal domain-containing protein [Elusimicrobia bacterium]|nr:PLDc N-terminal domain-containing protein [Elusimicrobiota bacterium]